jgi:hypothetical protein
MDRAVSRRGPGRCPTLPIDRRIPGRTGQRSPGSNARASERPVRRSSGLHGPGAEQVTHAPRVSRREREVLPLVHLRETAAGLSGRNLRPGLIQSRIMHTAKNDLVGRTKAPPSRWPDPHQVDRMRPSSKAAAAVASVLPPARAIDPGRPPQTHSRVTGVRPAGQAARILSARPVVRESIGPAR